MAQTVVTRIQTHHGHGAGTVVLQDKHRHAFRRSTSHTIDWSFVLEVWRLVRLAHQASYSAGLPRSSEGAVTLSVCNENQDHTFPRNIPNLHINRASASHRFELTSQICIGNYGTAGILRIIQDFK